MRIKVEQLELQLKKQGLMPVYLISSDEPYLQYEAEDCIRDNAKLKGFFERNVFDIDSKFDWFQFIDATQALSLFSKLKIIELRFLTKPDITAQKHLMTYFEQSSKDLLIIIRTAKLDAASLKSKWVTALDKIGGILAIYPPEPSALPNWISDRAKKMGIDLEPNAARFLSEHDEGNLLAIAQEISRMKILYGSEKINLDMLKSMMTDSARFGVFDLPDATLIGDIPRIKRMLDTLKAEGEEPILINWALQKEIRTLSKIMIAISSGQSMDNALSSVWEKRKPLYRNAIKRFNLERIKIMLQTSVEIDRAIKGNLKENPWDALLRLSFALAGKSFLPLSSNPKT